ncbi:MAG TPA: zinc ABC transporter substrate-binding protein, partial [Dermatophilaceae bacterium]|nr:zinc ABC transporter substrate-binding protein [Dermatophilaceae bacterium]
MPPRASLRAPHRAHLQAPLRAGRRPFFRRIALAGALIALLVAPAGCVSPRAAQEAAEATSLQVPVTAAFYPLAYLLEQVGGPGVKVFTLTKPGVEPHDLELTPKDLVDLPKMSVVA